MRFPKAHKGPGVCGISPGFPRLSPSRGQVIHVLLTRSPLYSRPEGRFRVRLACVRRAASVDSEPGSNSRLKGFRAPPPAGPMAPPPPRADLSESADPTSTRNQTKSYCTSNRSVSDPRRPGSPRHPALSPRPAVPAADQPRTRRLARAKQRLRGAPGPSEPPYTCYSTTSPAPRASPNCDSGGFPDNSPLTEIPAQQRSTHDLRRIRHKRGFATAAPDALATLHLAA